MTTREQSAAILARIPLEHTDLLFKEWRRRQVAVGKARVMTTCKKCGESFSAREIRPHARRCGKVLKACSACGEKFNEHGLAIHRARYCTKIERPSS